MAIITQIKPVLGTIHTVGRLLDTCLTEPISFVTHNMQVSLNGSVVTGYYTIRKQSEIVMVKEELIKGWKTAWLEEMYEKKGRGRPSTRAAYHFLIHLDDPPWRKILNTALLLIFSRYPPLDMGRSTIFIADSDGSPNGSVDISVLLHPIATTRYAMRFESNLPNWAFLFQSSIESLFSLSHKDIIKAINVWLSC